MKLIVVGSGRFGAELTMGTSAQGHEVTLIDETGESFVRLEDEFHGLTIRGNPLDRSVLERAGINEAEGVAAVTSDDTTNFVVARLASHIYKIPNVVARVYDPLRLSVFEELGIQAVASASWGARRIEQLLTHPGVIPLTTIGHGGATLLEVLVPDHASGMEVAALETSLPVKVAAVIRGGSANLFQADEQLEKGDLIVISVLSRDIKHIDTWVQGRK